MNNPYEHIDQRLDQIESLIREIQNSQKKSAIQINPNQRLTRRQVRDEYCVSYATIHKLMKTSDLQYEKIGRKTLFRRSEVDQFFRTRKGVGK